MTGLPEFCWVDLAATDLPAAAAFYTGAFGWSAREEHVAGGTLLRFHHGARDIASAYQLRPRHLAAGAPSHWTPYLRVAPMQRVLARVGHHGGRIVVPPFAVPGARAVALVQDRVGALLGLWEDDGALRMGSGDDPE